MAKVTPSITTPLFYVTSVDTTDTSGGNAKQFDTSAVGARTNVVLGYWPLEYNPPFSKPVFSDGTFYPSPWNNGGANYSNATLSCVTHGFTGSPYANNATADAKVRGTQLRWTTPSTVGYRWDDRNNIGSYGPAHATYTTYTDQWVKNIQRLAGAVARQCADFFYFHGYIKGTGTHTGQYWDGISPLGSPVYNLQDNAYMGCLTFRVGSHTNNQQTDICALFVHPDDQSSTTGIHNIDDLGNAAKGTAGVVEGALFPPWKKTGSSNAGADWPINRARYTPWCTNGIIETKIFYDALFLEMFSQFSDYLPYPELTAGATTTYHLCYPAYIFLDFEELNNNEFLYEIGTSGNGRPQLGAFGAIQADSKRNTETIFKDNSGSNRTWAQEYADFAASTPFTHCNVLNSDYTYATSIGTVTPFYGDFANGNAPLYNFLYNTYSAAYDYAINEAIYKGARLNIPSIKCSNYNFVRAEASFGRNSYGGWGWSDPRQSVCKGDVYSPVFYPQAPRQNKQGYSFLIDGNLPAVTSATSNTLTVATATKVKTTHSAAHLAISQNQQVSILDLTADYVYPSRTYVTDYFKGMTVNIVSGTGLGQSRRCMNYDGSTATFTVTPPWTVVPDNTSKYSISAESNEQGTIRCQTLCVQSIYKDKAVVPWVWAPGSIQEFGSDPNQPFMSNIVLNLIDKGIMEFIVWGFQASFNNFSAKSLDNFIGDVTTKIGTHATNRNFKGTFVNGIS